MYSEVIKMIEKERQFEERLESLILLKALLIKRKIRDLEVLYSEVIKMIEKERQFEERLESLILLKALLIKDNEFDEVAQKEYHEAWERAFDLLEQ